MRTKSRIRYKKLARLRRQANAQIMQTLSGDQRRIINLSYQGYLAGEIARELALEPEYVVHFMSGLIQRLSHNGLIPSPDWRNVILWSIESEIILDQSS